MTVTTFVAACISSGLGSSHCLVIPEGIVLALPACSFRRSKTLVLLYTSRPIKLLHLPYNNSTEYYIWVMLSWHDSSCSCFGICKSLI